MKTNKKYRTPIANARGLGSAKDGVSHWVWQRLTALMIAPISLWFIFSMMQFSQDATSYQMIEWLRSPFNALFLILLVGAIFFHATLGLQVIIEDYVHNEARKIIALILNKIIFLIAGLISIMSIISMHYYG
jgi:succinate dehydrogenase / fumarate reductase, membrane anchor subunit